MMSANNTSRVLPSVPGDRRRVICYWLVAAWLPLFLWSNLQATVAVKSVVSGLQLCLLLSFIAIHASLVVGWRGAGTFLLVGYGLGFGFEAMSINFGFPFGWFEHHSAGPTPFGVPLHVPLVYAFLGWLAWSLACLLVRSHPAEPVKGLNWAAALMAALILTGYDFAYDAIGSAIDGMWSYRASGGLFGVPLSNFIGWITTGFAICLIFSRAEPRFMRYRSEAAFDGSLLLPCIVWAGLATQFPVLQITASPETPMDAAIYEVSSIAALLSMAPPALAAFARAILLSRQA